MKKIKSFLVEKNKNNPLLLLAITAFLITIYVASIWKKRGDLLVSDLGIDGGDDLIIGGLFLLVVGSLVWEKRRELNLESSIIAKLVGALLIVLMLLKLSPEFFPGVPFPFSITQISVLVSAKVSIFIFAIGLAIIASGFRGLKQYWKELVILFFLSMPPVLLSWINISPVTTKFSTFVLWCLGFDVYIQNNIFIHTSNVSVEVTKGCSGFITMNYLLGISVILLIMFPLKRIYAIIVPLSAILLGFVANGFRVALMVILVAYNQIAAFDYWHAGNGGLVFTLVSTSIFVVFYFLLIRHSDIENPN